MKENTNSAIIINSIILYLRLGITAICGLLTTRFALQALGVDDFGLFSVVGGIISFIAIFNTIMLSTSNRFIATAIGKGIEDSIRDTFNVSLYIHCVIALLTLVVAFPLGEWYIQENINYSGLLDDVRMVYHISVLGSIISFVGVPYNGLLLAKERFFVFCTTDIIAHIIKVIVSFLLINMSCNKLFIYSLTIGVLTAAPTIIYILYCRKIFPNYVRLKFVNDYTLYKSILGFSIWVGYGAMATICKSQGAALIINKFFNTIMNTALGVANSVNGILLAFSNNISKSIAPQIVKSYSSGNMKRSEELVILSSKYSYLLMLFISSPFIVEPEFIYKLWLGSVPEFVVVFTYLIIADALVGSLNAGIPELIFATGKIKWYQIIVNTMFLMSVVIAYFVLKMGAPAYYLQIAYLFFSILVLVIRQIVLNKIVKFNNYNLLVKSYIPSLAVTLLFLPVFYLKSYLGSITIIFLSFSYLIILIYIIGMSKFEKAFLVGKIKNKVICKIQ